MQIPVTASLHVRTARTVGGPVGSRRAGVRGRAAVGILRRAGYKDVHSMSGGFDAWNGLQTTAFPTANATVLSGAESLAEVAEMAVALEANAYDLHLAMKRRFTDRASVQVFLALSRQEKSHIEKMTTLMLDSA